jgi:hypothetical protein
MRALGALFVAALASQALPDLTVTRLSGVPREPVSPSQTQPQGPIRPLPVTQIDDQVRADLDGPRRISLTVSRPDGARRSAVAARERDLRSAS